MTTCARRESSPGQRQMLRLLASVDAHFVSLLPFDSSAIWKEKPLRNSKVAMSNSCARRESNPQPHGPKPCTLSIELRAHN